MKSFFKLPLSLLGLALSLSLTSFSSAHDGEPKQKAFTVVLFPAADATKLWLLLEKYQPNDKINVELLDERGQVLFRETLPAKGSRRNAYRQQFDLNGVGDGNYTFRIRGSSQTETLAFNLSTRTVVEQLPARLISMN